MRWSTLPVLLLATSLAVAEEGLPGPDRARAWGWTSAVHADQVLPSYMGDGLETAVLPTPRRVVYSNRLFPVGRVTIVLPDAWAPPSTRRDLAALFLGVEPIRPSDYESGAATELVVSVGGPERNAVTKRLLEGMGEPLTQERRARLGKEGYLLLVGRGPKGRLAAVLAGNGPAGDFWALQTLRQLVMTRGEQRWVTGVWMLDWPAFPLRGSKEGRNYLPQYKDNFSWGDPDLELTANFGTAMPYVSGGGELDCSEANIARVASVLAGHFDAGVRVFALKFDDVIVGLDGPTSERFGGDYGKAICHFLRELDRRVKAWDPACRLVYLPQCFYTSSDYRGFARAIREAGGLPADVGLCWTGTEVFSRTIPAEDTRRYMEAFGATRTKGLIYDNYLRKGEYLPLRGRDASLVPLLAGIFSERSTRLTRMTRCDFNWNPEAYDPGRALKLACRETAGRDPKAYRALYAMVSALDRNREMGSIRGREERIERLDAVNGELNRLLGPLEKVMDPKAKIVADFRRAIDVRLRKQSRLKRAGYREARAARAGPRMVIDARLHEDAWQKAPVLTDFVVWDQVRWQKLTPEMGRPVATERQTEVRILYDEEFLYVSALARSDVPIADVECCTLSERARKKHSRGKTWWTGMDRTQRDVYGVWHSPSLELFIAPGADRMNYFHLVGNVAGLTYDKFSGQPIDMWNPAWRVAGRVDADGKGWSIEVAIPFESMRVKAPTKGDVWGLNVCRTWPGHQMWSFVWGPGGFHTPEDFGTLTFE